LIANIVAAAGGPAGRIVAMRSPRPNPHSFNLEASDRLCEANWAYVIGVAMPLAAPLIGSGDEIAAAEGHRCAHCVSKSIMQRDGAASGAPANCFSSAPTIAGLAYRVTSSGRSKMIRNSITRNLRFCLGRIELRCFIETIYGNNLHFGNSFFEGLLVDYGRVDRGLDDVPILNFLGREVTCDIVRR
jgi:hypothetical protein